MSLKRVADIRPKESTKVIEIRVLKKWKPHTEDFQKKVDLWFLFGDAIEAMCNAKDAGHFSSLLEVQKCYKITGCVSRPPRSYMPMVPHQASLFLGMRVDVQQIENIDIPTYYYNLATFDVLNSRKANPKLLTGRVDSISPELIRKGKRLKKVAIRDITGNPLEVTLWEEKRHLIPAEGAIGKAVVITATRVTQYTVMQLESTVSTTVEINPPFPELQTYLDRFSMLSDVPPTELTLEKMTVTQLASRVSDPNQQAAESIQLTNLELKVWADAMHRLKEIDHLKEMDIKQKLQIKWALDGDDNSKFFHGLLKSNNACSWINGLRGGPTTLKA
ncbi:hypothetical protein QVD17_16411 [Tagetes erecta]|uniref:Replication protein A OB domain-containing protein n=1 Tax=Tagetes erecta TaxID=13708 RepID=A0AAD8KU79_TARER|nr:hypothetical protein QVD17_16411 [Tagetes erecta]